MRRIFLFCPSLFRFLSIIIVTIIIDDAAVVCWPQYRCLFVVVLDADVGVVVLVFVVVIVIVVIDPHCSLGGPNDPGKLG